MGKEIAALGRRICCLETIAELRSNRELHIENCRKILEYHDIRIMLQTPELTLEIWGDHLEADSRSPTYLVIHGEIQSITLTPRRAGKR